jgi:hypothetical protein
MGKGGNAREGFRGRSVSSSVWAGVPARGFVGYIVLSAENDPLPVVVEVVEVGNGIGSRPLPLLRLPSLGTLSLSVIVTAEGTGDGVGPGVRDLKLGRALSSNDGLLSRFATSAAVGTGAVVVLDLTLKPSGKGGGLGVESFSFSFSFPFPVLNNAFKAPEDFLSESPDVLRASSFSIIGPGGGVATPRFLCASFCIAFNSFLENMSACVGRWRRSSDFRKISSDLLNPSSDFLERNGGVDILVPDLKIFNRLGLSKGAEALSRMA